jgi:hypothetical protein
MPDLFPAETHMQIQVRLLGQASEITDSERFHVDPARIVSAAEHGRSSATVNGIEWVTESLAVRAQQLVSDIDTQRQPAIIEQAAIDVTVFLLLLDTSFGDISLDMLLPCDLVLIVGHDGAAAYRRLRL